MRSLPLFAVAMIASTILLTSSAFGSGKGMPARPAPGPGKFIPGQPIPLPQGGGITPGGLGTPAIWYVGWNTMTRQASVAYTSPQNPALINGPSTLIKANLPIMEGPMTFSQAVARRDAVLAAMQSKVIP
jgi:hypothetical protein